VPGLYPCPSCGEEIQKLAAKCRFCGVDVRVDVTLARQPDPAKMVDATRALFGQLKSGFFSTYGALRRKMQKPGAFLARGVTREEGEAIAQTLEAHGGSGNVLIQHLDRKRTERNSRRWLPYLLTLFFAVTAVTSIYVGMMKKQGLEPLSTVPPEIPVNVPVFFSPEPAPAVAAAPPTTAEKETHLRLRQLIAATATVQGNNVTGSAFFVHPDGYLVTNEHVIHSMTDIHIVTPDGARRPARVVRKDDYFDLALLKADGGPFPTLKVGDATTLNQGDTVWTIGAPHGLAFTVTRGVVSYVGRVINGKAFLQADVAINPGNSGGPMINDQGEAVGINNFIISNAQGLNFSIPINYIYMGASPIGQGILTIVPDNETMARWRSEEKTNDSSSPSVSMQSPSKPDSSDRTSELSAVLSRIGELQRENQRRQMKDAADLERLNTKRAEAESRAAQARDISEETAAEREAEALRTRFANEGVSILDSAVRRAREIEGLLIQAQNLAGRNHPLSPQIDAQVLNIRRQIQEAETQKESLQAQLHGNSD